MATLNQGMNRYVPIVYGNAIAAFVLAPFALVLESHRESSGGDDSDKQWVAGTLLILLGCVSWSSSYVLQGAAIAVAVERRSSGWAVDWDSRLFAPLYTQVSLEGLSGSGLAPSCTANNDAQQLPITASKGATGISAIDTVNNTDHKAGE
ncbi:hypothetical protein WN943_008362 [Citrus x changshan-huyou]